MKAKVENEEKPVEEKAGRTLFLTWCWGKALPVIGASLVPIILATVIGSLSAYSAGQEASKEMLREQNTELKKLKDADAAFKQYLEERRNVRDKQLDKIESSIGDLKKDSLSKEIFDAYWQSYKDDKTDRETRDRMILDQLQRISPYR